MALPEYPKAIDAEVWAVVLDAVHGKFPNAKHAVHCLYEVEGYALGMFYADFPSPTLLTASEGVFDAEKFIEAQATGKKMAGKIDWKALFQLVLSILGPLILKEPTKP